MDNDSYTPPQINNLDLLAVAVERYKSTPEKWLGSLGISSPVGVLEISVRERR